MPSSTPKQKRTMGAAAHDPAFAKKMGIPQSVARDFNRADTQGYAGGGGVNMAGKEDDAIRRRINDTLEDYGTDSEREIREIRGRRPPISPPIFKTPTKPNYPAERDLQRGDYDAAPPMASPSGRGPETGYRRGGKVNSYAEGGVVRCDHPSKQLSRKEC